MPSSASRPAARTARRRSATNPGIWTSRSPGPATSQSWSGGTATIAQIRSEIRGGRPLGARIGWSGGGGHFVMIAGYRSCDPDQYIDVRDPIYGSSDLPLATFTSSYQGSGSWTHTYYTEP